MHSTLEKWLGQSRELLEMHQDMRQETEDYKKALLQMEKGKDVVKLLEKKLEIQKKKKSKFVKAVARKLNNFFGV